MATCYLHFTINREQAQRLIWLAADQIVEIMADSGQRPLRKRNACRVSRAFLLLKGFKQRLQCFSKLRDTIKTNDRQCALYLVQVSAAELDLRQIAGAGAVTGARCILLQRLIGALQREVNLAFDPG